MSAISAIKKALEDGFARGDEESLVAFHHALLQGELLVAASGEVELPVVLAGETVELGGVRDIEGQPIVAAFTGEEELDFWAGPGAARRSIAVPELARAVLAGGIHTLSLNPAGPVGRFLDAVELRQLAAGVEPRIGRASFGFDARSGVAVAAPAEPPVPALLSALQSVCAFNSDIVASYLVELMQPLRSADVGLAVALQVDPGTDRARQEALMELVGACVTAVPDADLEGVAFVWLDGRLDGLVRARVRPVYVRGS